MHDSHNPGCAHSNAQKQDYDAADTERHELTSNGEGEGAVQKRPISATGAYCLPAPRARTHGPFTVPPNACQAAGLALSLMCHLAMLAMLIKNTAAAATSAQIVKFMAKEW